MATPVNNSNKKPNKQVPAILAAFGMTMVVGVIIVAVSFNSLFNTNVVPVQASPNTASATATTSNQQTADQQTVQQLQNLVQQYQTRDQQYQTELQQAADQLSQTQSQLQQYQMLMNALQQAGVIQVRNGQVFISRGSVRGDGN